MGVWLALVVLGMPIFLSLGVASLGYLWVHGDVLLAVPQRLTAAANSFTLLAAPFFMLVGLAMNTAGVTQRIYQFAEGLTGWLRGGLAHVNVVGSVIFAGMSGSAVADAAGLGAIEIKAMTDEGYEREFAAAVTAASATIGPIIPPSVPLLFYGVLADTSIGRLFLGGLVPGLLMAALLMVMVAWMSHRRGYRAHPFPGIREMTHRTWRAAPSLLTPALLLGGMLGGVFTPTEAAFVAAAYALVLGLVVHRELRWRDVPRLFRETVETNGVVLLLVMASSLFGWVLTRAQLPQQLGAWFLAASTDPLVVLLLINLFLLVVGCFMEALAALVILVPLFLPVIKTLGIDPVHFGVLMVLNLMIGTLTPPIGIVLFVVSRVANLPFEAVVRSTLPFLVPLVCVLLLITVFPDLVLFVPRLVLGP
ncbi:MAG: TRAP transporter large permease [Armatimonadota bacterium]|nr:TRAP transporter large permease [Armatimonadota bacterium]MDR7484943.1 TRAP transporter large permease [Armatimonadota bacterium]MDR7533646.1 TRAP transporter large permease [Armatimonadota bacterium]MDR7535457.1 TRAP transporter large permease [Armatimonadota bacterium]